MSSAFTPGQSLPAHTRPPFDAGQLQEYANASGDHNPIHLDPKFAEQAGFPSVIVHGMLSMAYLGDYIRQVFPQEKFQVKRFRSRFKKVTFPSDSLTLKGEIKAISPEGVLNVSLWAENQKGEITVDGDADLIPQT